MHPQRLERRTDITVGIEIVRPCRTAAQGEDAVGILPGTTWLYFALSQFPIYLSPQLLKPIVRKLNAPGIGSPFPEPATGEP